MRGKGDRANCLPGPREPFKRDAVYLASGQLKERAEFVVSRNLTLFRSTVSGRRHSMILRAGTTKKHVPPLQ